MAGGRSPLPGAQDRAAGCSLLPPGCPAPLACHMQGAAPVPSPLLAVPAKPCADRRRCGAVPRGPSCPTARLPRRFRGEEEAQRNNASDSAPDRQRSRPSLRPPRGAGPGLYPAGEPRTAPFAATARPGSPRARFDLGRAAPAAHVTRGGRACARRRPSLLTSALATAVPAMGSGQRAVGNGGRALLGSALPLGPRPPHTVGKQPLPVRRSELQSCAGQNWGSAALRAPAAEGWLSSG